MFSMINPDGLTDIENVIHFIRGRRIMLSTDLSRLYNVAPKILVQALKRNKERFPEDFAFRLTLPEQKSLNSYKLSQKWGRHAKYPPHAFTEQGVAMLSSVLKSRKAIRVNVAIMRVFVRLRGALSIHHDVIRKLSELESKVHGHEDQLAILAEAIQDLKSIPEEPPKPIGFQP